MFCAFISLSFSLRFECIRDFRYHSYGRLLLEFHAIYITDIISLLVMED